MESKQKAGLQNTRKYASNGASEGTAHPLTPMSQEDLKKAFEEISLFVARVETIVQASVDLGDAATISCNLCYEALELLGGLSRDVNDYELRIINAGVTEKTHSDY